jgi:hypothetical protein
MKCLVVLLTCFEQDTPTIFTDRGLRKSRLGISISSPKPMVAADSSSKYAILIELLRPNRTHGGTLLRHQHHSEPDMHQHHPTKKSPIRFPAIFSFCHIPVEMMNHHYVNPAHSDAQVALAENTYQHSDQLPPLPISFCLFTWGYNCTLATKLQPIFDYN